MNSKSVYEWALDITSSKKEGMIVSDTVDGANMLIKHCAKRQGIVCGISATNIKSIAFEYAVKGITGIARPVLIDTEAAVSILRDIIGRNHDITFIPKESICKMVLTDVYDKICLLRASKASAPDAGIKRIEQLFKLSSYFEEELEQNCYYDECRALMEAINYLEGTGSDLNIAVNRNKNLNLLQKEFLKLVTARGSLTSVYVPQELTDIPSERVHFFRGYGVFNEVRYCLLQIEKQKMPFGDTAIICSNPAYIPYTQSILGGADIPYTLRDQKAVMHLRRIQLINQILTFAKEGFVYELLRPVFMGGALFLGEGISPGDLFVHGISDNIGKGRERFIRVADKRLSELEASGDDSEKTGKYIIFYKFIRELACAFPDDGAEVLPLELLYVVDSILKKHMSISAKKESAITTTAIERIAGKLRYEKKESLAECIQKVQEAIEDSTIEERDDGASVLVAGMGKVLVTDRKNLFFIGLSNTYFMQDTTQSPVLTDKELSDLAADTEGLRLASEKGLRFTESFLNTLKCIEDPANKNLFFGTTIYNSIKLQEDSPAPVYHELMKTYANGKRPEDFELLEYDDFTVCLTGKSAANTSAATPQPEADNDENKEGAPEISMVEQRIREQAEHPQFSPSSFQVLMSCPRKYYYEYILKIRKEDYQVISPDVWLSSNARGNFFHYTLESYCKKVLIENDSVTPDLDEDAFCEAFEDARAKVTEECPPGLPDVVEYETLRIKETCREYIASLHAQLSQEQQTAEKWRVKGCEYPLSDNVHDPILMQDSLIGISDEEELKSKIGKKNTEMKLIGSIDRLDHYFDENGVEHFRIIDYKTGNIESFRDKLGMHTQLQHLFYAMGVKNGEKTAVDCVKYVFPFDSEEIEKKESLLNLPKDVLSRYEKSCAIGRYERNYVAEDLDFDDEVLSKYCSYCSYGKMGICPEMIRKSTK